MRNCVLTGTQLFQDIVSYNLPLIGCSESSSDEEIRVCTGLPKLFTIVSLNILKKQNLNTTLKQIIEEVAMSYFLPS